MGKTSKNPSLRDRLSSASDLGDGLDTPDSTGPGEFYTIAYSQQSGLLLACVPAGHDIYRAVERHFKNAPVEAPAPSEVIVVEGLSLTNDENQGDIVYGMCPNDRVWLQDTCGNQFAYTVKLNPPS